MHIRVQSFILLHARIFVCVFCTQMQAHAHTHAPTCSYAYIHTYIRFTYIHHIGTKTKRWPLNDSDHRLAKRGPLNDSDHRLAKRWLLTPRDHRLAARYGHARFAP